MSLCRWIHRLFGRGYWVCPDDWQGDLRECRRVEGKRPIEGVSVYYESNGVLKPWGKR